MIYPAILYKERIDKAFTLTRTKHYRYFYSEGYFSAPKIKDDEWNVIQRVSVDSRDNVLGFMSCRINRPINNGYSIQLINFGNQDIVFSRDIMRFFTSLFRDYGLRKINFSVIIGNPAEDMYDNAVFMFGGRIIGFSKEEAMLPNGEICDEKNYEIMRSDVVHKL